MRWLTTVVHVMFYVPEIKKQYYYSMMYDEDPPPEEMLKEDAWDAVKRVVVPILKSIDRHKRKIRK